MARELESADIAAVMEDYFATLLSPDFQGEPTAPTPPTSDESIRLATTLYVANKIAAMTGDDLAALQALLNTDVRNSKFFGSPSSGSDVGSGGLPVMRHLRPDDFPHIRNGDLYRPFFDFIDDHGRSMEWHRSKTRPMDGVVALEAALDRSRASGDGRKHVVWTGWGWQFDTYPDPARLGGALIDCPGIAPGQPPMVIAADPTRPILYLTAASSGLRMRGTFSADYRSVPASTSVRAVHIRDGAHDIYIPELILGNTTCPLYLGDCNRIRIGRVIALGATTKIIATSGAQDVRIGEWIGPGGLSIDPAADVQIGSLFDANNPTAPTQPVGNNSTKIATTEFVLRDGSLAAYKAATSALSQTIESRLRKVIYLDDWTVSDGITDDTTAAQQCINYCIANSIKAIVARTGKTTMVSSIRLDGTGGTGTGMMLYLEAGAVIKKLDNAAIATASARRNSVIYAVSGHDHLIAGPGRIEGNMSRGGVAPPYCTNWVPSQAYSTVGSIVSASADGTYANPRHSNDRIFRVVTAHTSDATNILTDVSAGRMEEVTSQAWDEMTGTGYLNSYNLDADFAYRHGVYFNGQSEVMRGCAANGISVTDTVYGGILLGKGPLFASNAYHGTIDAKVIDCHTFATGATGIGGGGAVRRLIAGNVAEDTDSSCIRCDEGSEQNIIAFNRMTGQGAATNGGLSIYKSANTIVFGNRATNCAIGITATNSDGLQSYGNDWVDNYTNTSLREVDNFSIADTNRGAITGHNISVTKASGTGKIGGIASGALLGHGLYCDDAYALDVDVQATGNAKDGAYLNNVRTSIIAGSYHNNGKVDATYKAGIRLVDSYDNEIIHPSCRDTNLAGSKTQNYGIVESGSASSGNVLYGGRLAGNNSAPLSVLTLAQIGSRTVQNNNSRTIGPVVASVTTTGTTPTPITPDATGAGNIFALSGSTSVAFRGIVVARAPSSGAAHSWEIDGLIRKGSAAGSTALVGSSVTSKYSDASATGWTGPAISADTVADGLKITVSGPSGGTVRWTATIRLEEVA